MEATTKISIGGIYSFKKSFSLVEVQRFAELSRDHNPLHTDVAYAKDGPFGANIVHGMLAASLFSAILGTKYPGEGTIYLKQDLKFLRPVFIDEEVTAMVAVTAIAENVGDLLITLTTTLTKQNGKEAITGEAQVLLRRK
ncbi:MAG: MaoC family dehydratase [Deltaproteobacteria bacterium]|nr:MaoC family dehydratase [Deltaproteobacteria bacterium]